MHARRNKILREHTIATLEASAVPRLAPSGEETPDPRHIERTRYRLHVCEAAMGVHAQTMTSLVEGCLANLNHADLNQTGLGLGSSSKWNGVLPVEPKRV